MPLTDNEQEVIDLLGQAAGKYKKILDTEDAKAGRTREYPWDVIEFVSHIHDLQARVMARVAIREQPDRFRPQRGGDIP